MSGKCGNCDCSDKSQCGKNGTEEIFETNNFVATAVMDVAASENDCKCGSNCTCTSCGCGH